MSVCVRSLMALPVCLLLAGPAWAGGDMESAGVGCVPGPFSGAYIGGSAGYLNARMKATNGATNTDRDSGWAAGGFIGYNRQCGDRLFGVEADISWMNADPSKTISQSGVVEVGGGEFPIELPFSSTEKVASSYDFFGTLRGRFGIVRDHTLFYLTGGLAYAGVKHSYDASLTIGDFTESISLSDSDVKWGWTAGGGVEFVRDNRWSLRAEVLYVDLQDSSINFNLGDECGFAQCNGRVKFDDHFVVARLGVSIKLHREPEHHEPLK